MLLNYKASLNMIWYLLYSKTFQFIQYKRHSLIHVCPQTLFNFAIMYLFCSSLTIHICQITESCGAKKPQHSSGAFPFFFFNHTFQSIHFKIYVNLTKCFTCWHEIKLIFSKNCKNIMYVISLPQPLMHRGIVSISVKFLFTNNKIWHKFHQNLSFCFEDISVEYKQTDIQQVLWLMLFHNTDLLKYINNDIAHQKYIHSIYTWLHDLQTNQNITETET